VPTALAALALATAPAAAGPSAPSRLLVTAKEWSLIMSRQTVKPGDARIQLYNAGEDAHDLRLKRAGGKRALRMAVTSPGGLTELKTRLRGGRWKLWCSLPEHAKRGMRATLTVRR
jgi:plastocyanin